MSFRGQKILQPGHQDALFFLEKTDDPFSCRPQNTGRQRRFTVKIKQIKRSDTVTFLFSVHTITKAKQYAILGRAEPWLSQGSGSSSKVFRFFCLSPALKWFFISNLGKGFGERC